MAFVHPNPASEGETVAAEFGLADIARVSDPAGRLYRAFGLGTARISQFFQPSVIRRYWQAWRAGHGVGKPTGDIWLMPGVFLVHNGSLVRAYRHPTPADRPDYLALARPLT